MDVVVGKYVEQRTMTTMFPNKTWVEVIGGQVLVEEAQKYVQIVVANLVECDQVASKRRSEFEWLVSVDFFAVDGLALSCDNQIGSANN